jgi:hypothetical protein
MDHGNYSLERDSASKYLEAELRLIWKTAGAVRLPFFYERRRSEEGKCDATVIDWNGPVRQFAVHRNVTRHSQKERMGRYRFGWMRYGESEMVLKERTMNGGSLPVRLIVLVGMLFVGAMGNVYGQTTATIVLTNEPTAITTTTSGTYFTLFENSATPTAVWSVAPVIDGVTQVAVNEQAGAQFVFTPRSSSYAAGTILGYAQSVGAGPYNFILVQYSRTPAYGTVTNTSGALGAGMFLLGNGGNDIKANPNVTYDSKNGMTLTAPLLSNATILGITNNGTTSTMTCDIAGCGLTVGGPTLNLGEGMPASCADLAVTITAISGNTASFPSSKCSASGGPYSGQIGTIGTQITLHNAAGNSTSNTTITETADSHTDIKVNHSGATQTELDLQAGGPLSLDSLAEGVSFSIGPDQLACVGQPSRNAGGNCTAAGFNSAGTLATYMGLASTGAGHGQPFIVYGAGPAALSGNFGPYTIYTCPANGYGAGSLYRVNFYLVETSGASGATMQLQLNHTDEAMAEAQNSGAPVAFEAIGAHLPWNTIFSCVAGQPISFQTITTNAPAYSLYVTLEIL